MHIVVKFHSTRIEITFVKMHHPKDLANDSKFTLVNKRSIGLLAYN